MSSARITPKEAKLIAKELAKELFALIHGDLQEASVQIALEKHEDWLSSDEATEMLGWSKKTLYRSLHLVPHTKVGRKYRFPRSGLQKFIREGRPA